MVVNPASVVIDPAAYKVEFKDVVPVTDKSLYTVGLITTNAGLTSNDRLTVYCDEITPSATAMNVWFRNIATTTSSHYFIGFRNSGGNIGGVRGATGTSVAYATTSDLRKKKSYFY